jgi:tetratricopeptide (TPR) repeat protein
MAASTSSQGAARLRELEEQARDAFQSADVPTLEAACEAILKADATNLLALELLGTAAFRSGNLRRSEHVLKKAVAAHPRDAHIVNTLGVVLARRGRQSEAMACYRQSLALDPDYPRPQINLGNALCGQGRIEDGISSFRRVLALDPGNAEAHYCLGNARRKLGQANEAAESYRSALALHPRLLDAQINLGALLSEQGETDEAAEWLERALEIAPHSVNAMINLGIVRRRQGKAEDAAELFRRALGIEPKNPQILLQLGRSLADQERWSEALEAFGTAAEIAPRLAEAQLDMGDVFKVTRRWRDGIAAYLRAVDIDPLLAQRLKHYRLGLACAETGDYATAAEAMLAPVRRLQGTATKPPEDAALKVTRCKLLHDLEQLGHLRAKGLLGADYDPVMSEYRDALKGHPLGAADNAVEVDARRHPNLTAQLYRLAYLAEAPALPGGALNRDLDTAAIEAAYAAESPGVTTVDDLLSPEALESLRRFCLESTIWWQLEHPTEVGSTQASGFACPLLLQIAHELRQALPGVLGEHPFTTMWAYKYYDPPGREGADNRSSGRRIHADAGMVSVNLWITPDEANLGPETGGVTFWNQVAPKAYFKVTSREERLDMLRPLMDSAGPPRLVVPHRCNRAAIFHSYILHRSSPQRFRETYEDRRISITIMYGDPYGGG